MGFVLCTPENKWPGTQCFSPQTVTVYERDSLLGLA